MNTPNLEDLAVRVEQASGPDRAIDGDIAFALGLQPSWATQRHARQPELFGDGGTGLRAKTWLAPKFSASLDAAMTLVPEGWRFGVERAGIYDGKQIDEAWCWPFDSSFEPDWQNGHQGYRDAPDGTRGYAATPALALCAAALRARSEYKAPTSTDGD